jgi:hypothetical protein
MYLIFSFVLCYRPNNFAIVNFLDHLGKKTDEQEIVPVNWIINGKQPKCLWPKDNNISRKQLDDLVIAETIPSRAEFKTFPVRILDTGCKFP